MIGDMSELVGFIGAIYFTITVDNLLFKRFWTPDFYKLIEMSLKRFDFALSTPLKESLMSSVREKSRSVEFRARYRGAFLLSICVYILIFCSLEPSLQQFAIHYNALLCTLVISIFIFICGLFAWRRLRILVVCILSVPVIYFICHYFLTTLESTNKLSLWLNDNPICLYAKCTLIVFLIIPIIGRLIFNWLNSNVYAEYLIKKLDDEYEKYSSTAEGIRTKDESKCAQEYDGVFKKIYLSSALTDDEVMTEFNDVLIDRLKQTVNRNSWWTLIQYHFSTDTKTSKTDFSKSAEIYYLPDYKVESYEAHCRKYSSLKDVKIRDYCKKHNIDEIAFRKYRKEWMARLK